MTSPKELEDLMQRSLKDFREEPAFFRAMLDATLYAHAPLDQSERLRLVMIKSPDDGEYVVPVFTDEAKAEFAAQGNVRIVALMGRTLLDITLGAVVMLNPNDARCTLYPEEINKLLASGIVTPVQKRKLRESETRYYKLDKLPQTIKKALKKTLPDIRGIDVAYVAGLQGRQADSPDSVLIALGGRADRAEREVRATATALNHTIDELDRPVDIIHFDSSKAKPDWIRRLGLTPVYRRRLGQPPPVSKYN